MRRFPLGGAAAVLLVVTLATHCTTGRQQLSPLDPLSAASADAAWNELLRLRRTAPRLASYASVRVESGVSKQSFRATLATDERGRFRVEAFSPMGTAAFTLFVEGTETTMVDHVNRTWWKGPFPTAARSLGLPESLDAHALAMLTFGLPASSLDGSERGGRIVQDGVEYLVERAGIVEARGDAWTASFASPSFPADSVTIATADGTRAMTVRHIEAGAASRAVDAPKIAPSYRCCVEPTAR